MPDIEGDDRATRQKILQQDNLPVSVGTHLESSSSVRQQVANLS
jgi:hypothetical protein